MGKIIFLARFTKIEISLKSKIRCLLGGFELATLNSMLKCTATWSNAGELKYFFCDGSVMLEPEKHLVHHFLLFPPPMPFHLQLKVINQYFTLSGSAASATTRLNPFCLSQFYTHMHAHPHTHPHTLTHTHPHTRTHRHAHIHMLTHPWSYNHLRSSIH